MNRSELFFQDFFFFQAEDGIRDYKVTGVQTCALPIFSRYYHPDEFAELAGIGRELGFTHVEAGPLLPSSYHAKRQAGAAAPGGTKSALPNRAGAHPLARPPPKAPAPPAPRGKKGAPGAGAA